MNTLLYVSKRVLHPAVRVRLIKAYSAAKSWWKYGDSNFPSHIWIETVTNCNRTCWYCPNSVKPIPDQLMSAKVFSLILERLKEIKWTGPVGYHYLSEPLLHPNIVELVEQTKAALPGSMPIIFSNGDRLTLDLAKQLKSAGLSKCSVTRHKPVTEDWERRMREVTSFAPSIFDVTEIGKANLINLAGVIKGLKGKPIHKHCMAPKHVIPIRINGDISLCCCDYEQKYTFGNVLTHSIRELWPSPYWKQRRDNLFAGVREFDICRNCTGVK